MSTKLLIMKTGFIIFISILFNTITSSQDTDYILSQIKTENISNLNESVDSSNIFPLIINDTVWTLDSTHNYVTINNTLLLNIRYKVLSRNTKGNIISSIIIENKNGKWKNKSLKTIKYFDDITIKESFEQPWNSSQQSWIDTISFVKYDQNHNKVLSISKKWNDEQNKFNYGRRTKYIFDSQNNNILKTESNWNNVKNIWENSIQYMVEYNSSKRKLSNIKQVWDNNTNSWKNNIKYLIIYNNKDIVTQLITQEWKNEKWVNKEKTLTLFNQNDKKDSVIVYNWTQISNNWEYNSVKIFEYNLQGYETLSKESYWDKPQNKWIITYIKNNVYNNNNKIIEKTTKRWNSKTLKLKSGNKHLYSYDGEGHKSQTLDQNLDLINESWVNTTKIKNIYDTKIKTSLKQKWDKQNKNWVNFSNSSYLYYSDNKLKELKKDIWDVSSKSWDFSTKSNYSYNTNRNLKQSVINKWNKTLNNWKIFNKTDYFWSKFITTTLNQISAPQIKVFPNPTSKTLNIEMNQISHILKIIIISESGKLLYSKNKIIGNLDLSFLNSGIYFLQINTKNGNVTKRIVLNNSK